MRLVLLGCLLLVACPSRSQVRLLARADGPPVVVGHYPDYLVMLSGDHPLARKADRLRQDVESHESFIRHLTRSRFDIRPPLEFSFMYVAYDSASSSLVLRYFARNPEPVIFAGWQVQLVYSLPALRLARAYVEEVPLE
jgi:hypothetical protein